MRQLFQGDISCTSLASVGVSQPKCDCCFRACISYYVPLGKIGTSTSATYRNCVIISVCQWTDCSGPSDCFLVCLYLSPKSSVYSVLLPALYHRVCFRCVGRPPSLNVLVVQFPDSVKNYMWTFMKLLAEVSIRCPGPPVLELWAVLFITAVLRVYKDRDFSS